MIVKNRLKSDFSQIPNALILDSNLKPGALKVILYLWTRPPDWKVNNSDIQKACRIRRPETMAEYWRQIMDSGWVSRHPRRNNGGIFGGYDYVLNLSPTTKEPDTVYPYTEEPDTVTTGYGKNSSHNNTEYINNTEYVNNTEKNKRVSPQKSATSQAENINENQKENSHRAGGGGAWTSDWLDRYAAIRKESGHAFSGFMSKDFKAMLTIKAKFKKIYKEKYGVGYAISESEMADLFEWLVRKAQNVDDFLNNNPAPSILASQFDKIINYKSKQKRQDQRQAAEFEAYFSNKQ